MKGVVRPWNVLPQLTPELEQYVNGKVRGGMYHSASEVVREGLRLLRSGTSFTRGSLKSFAESSKSASTRPTEGRSSL